MDAEIVTEEASQATNDGNGELLYLCINNTIVFFVSFSVSLDFVGKLCAAVAHQLLTVDDII